MPGGGADGSVDAAGDVWIALCIVIICVPLILSGSCEFGQSRSVLVTTRAASLRFGECTDESVTMALQVVAPA